MTAKRPRTRTADDRAAEIAEWLGRHKDDLVPPPIWYAHMCWLLDNRRPTGERFKIPERFALACTGGQDTAPAPRTKGGRMTWPPPPPEDVHGLVNTGITEEFMTILLSVAVLLLLAAFVCVVLALAGKLPNGVSVAVLLIVIERLIALAPIR